VRARSGRSARAAMRFCPGDFDECGTFVHRITAARRRDHRSPFWGE
jgi:hypothetical protein